VLLALSWYDQRVHQGVARFAAAHGWELDARMAYSRERAWGWRGDGVLAKLGCSRVDEELVRFVKSLALPTVDLSVFGPSLGVPGVEFDPQGIGERFAFFPALDDEPIAARRRGFAAALAARGRELALLAPVDAAQGERGWMAAEEELGARLARASEAGPLGVLAFNDEWAAQLVRAADRAGLDVPGRVAVLGVDDQALACESARVPLSSVALDFEGWGEAAAALLDRAMDGEKLPGELVLHPAGRVVARLSTDVVAVAHPDVRAAVDLIARELPSGISVDDVVQKSRLSRSGLKSAFARTLGRSIQEELERARSQRIELRLRETDWSLERIASDVGLANTRTLQRLFARRNGCSPSEYRERHTRRA
jgi:LacI family transcriptional regulator